MIQAWHVYQNNTRPLFFSFFCFIIKLDVNKISIKLFYQAIFRLSNLLMVSIFVVCIIFIKNLSCSSYWCIIHISRKFWKFCSRNNHIIVINNDLLFIKNFSSFICHKRLFNNLKDHHDSKAVNRSCSFHFAMIYFYKIINLIKLSFFCF